MRRRTCPRAATSPRSRALGRRVRRRALLDVHTDADHHRSVFTLAGAADRRAPAAARRAGRARSPTTSRSSDTPACTRASARSTSCRSSRSGGDAGASRRPRRTRSAFGALVGRDVTRCRCFFYDDADARRAATLPHACGATRSRRARPTSGRARRIPTLGATAVGARAPLVAINCVLDAGDVDDRPRDRTASPRTRRRPARRARARLLPRAAAHAPQVSMNLIDLDRTGIEDACTARARTLAATPRDRRRGGRARRPGARRPSSTAAPTTFLAWSRTRRRASTIEAPASGRWRPGDRSTRARRWRCRGAPARAGGGCGGAPARTCRPRSRTSRRAAARTRGSRPCTSQPSHTALASLVEAPRSGKNRSGSTPRQLARSCQRRSPGSTSSWISISRIGCPLAPWADSPAARLSGSRRLAPANTADGITTVSSWRAARRPRKGKATMPAEIIRTIRD